MAASDKDDHALYRYAWLLAGFLLLLINHLSVATGHPWLIPPFLRPY